MPEKQPQRSDLYGAYKVTEVELLHFQVTSLAWVALVLLVAFLGFSMLFLDAREKLATERELLDVANDRICYLEKQVSDQAKLIVKRPVVYKNRVVYKELP